MTAFRSLARAMLKGFFRDRMALFFSILFPLMFLLSSKKLRRVFEKKTS